jgi:hypothetical protein
MKYFAVDRLLQGFIDESLIAPISSLGFEPSYDLGVKHDVKPV